MNYVRFDVKASEAQQELLIASLDEYGALGFEQLNSLLVTFFSEDESRLDEVGKVLNGFDYTQQAVPHQNWNEEWERAFQPITVEDFCAVRAHFHPPVPAVKHQIIVTPKMSFGTGHHATTYLMLHQMAGIDFTDRSVFDFGTGTGILSILASKSGAKKITAIDVDEWSVANAAENFEQNACTGIDLRLSANVPDRTFDVILANINRNVLLDNMPMLKNALLPTGHLLLSGLLVNDETAILQSTEGANLRLLHRGEREGWLSLLFTNAP